MTGKMRDCIRGLILGLCGRPLLVVADDPVKKTALVSADGYVLISADGFYLIPKECE